MCVKVYITSLVRVVM